jgi:nitrate reductase gamma subunit
LHDVVTEVIVGGVAVTVTAALPDIVMSSVLVAVTVTGFVAGTALGAVYRPAPEMVPTVEFPPATPLTLHATAVLKLPVPVTVAAHCEVVPI